MEEIKVQPVEEPPNIHQFISEKKVEDVLKFIDSNPNERVVVFNGDSAIALSLKCGFLDMYEVLLANGFKLAASEDFTDILRDIEENPKVESAIKVKLKEIHRKYMKESTKKHLFKLNLMAKLAPTTPKHKQQEYEGIIASTFEELDRIADVEKFMKYVSSAKGRFSDFFIGPSAFMECRDCRLSILFRFWQHDNRRDESKVLWPEDVWLDLFCRWLHLHCC